MSRLLFQLSDRGERRVDRTQIILLDDLPVGGLGGAAVRLARELELEAEAQADPVRILLDVVVDGAEHRAVEALELHLLLRHERDAFAATLAAKFDFADEDILAFAVEHLAMGHRRHEGQSIVRLHHQPLPYVAAGELRLAGLRSRECVGIP